MSVGLSNLTDNYYLNYVNHQSRSTEADNGIGFNGILAAKATENAAKTEQSFKDMWQARFPGAYYHTMDAYKISSGSWQRYDFPHELFFSDQVDESVLDWKPVGADAKLTDRSVQSRIDSTLGKKAIVVPAALEEKMKNDPALAQRVMEKVERLIIGDVSMLPPDRIYSYVVVLDEDGEIAHACGSSGGGELTGPTEAEMRQFEAEQAAKRKRRAMDMQIIEESALERSEKQARLNREYYQNKSVTKAIEKYESLFL